MLQIPETNIERKTFITDMYSPRGLFFFILILVWSTLSAEVLENEYKIIDGIRVRKDPIRKEIDQLNQRGKKDRKQPSRPETNGNEHMEQDQEDQHVDEDDDDDDDSNDDVDEDLEATKHLPTKCHGEQV